MRNAVATRIGSMLTFIALSAGFAAAQDLGSANKLFNSGTKTSTNSTKTTKKPQSKAKPSSSKTTTSSKKPTTSIKTNSAATNERFEQLIEDGNAARDSRDYAAAEKAYTKASELKPGDWRAIYGLGNLYSDQQRWEKAEKAYRDAIKLDPANVFSTIALSYVLTQPIAVSDLGDRYAEAEKLARKAIQLDGSNNLAFDQLGVSMEMRGLVGAETENAYRRAIQIDPSFAPVYAHLGRLLRRRGLGSESSEAYKKAISLATDPATLVIVANVMQSEQRFAESEPLLRNAIAGDPKNPTALMLLGQALTAQEKFAEAETTLRNAVSVSPNACTPNILLGVLFSRQNKYPQAENALLQAVRFVSPLEKRFLAHQFEVVGDGYVKTGNREGAERAYRQAMALDSDNPSLANKLKKGSIG